MELSKKIVGTVTSLLLIFSCQEKPHYPNNPPMDKTFCGVIDYVSTDFTKMGVFTDGIEGPAINSKGELFIVNFDKQGTIGKVDSSGQGTIYFRLPEGSIGNSIRFDEEDNMYVADYAGHNIYKVTQDLSLDTLVDHQGFNQPNDIALAINGNIYASDPNWSQNSGQLWLVKNRKAILQEDSMGTTNGIELSLDEKRLYVNESVQRNVWVYDVNEDGSLMNKKLFHQFEDFGMDGMKVDGKGNLYIARYGAGVIAVLSPQGKFIKEYSLQGQHPTNLVFSKDGRSIFVTMQKRMGVEKIRLD